MRKTASIVSLLLCLSMYAQQRQVTTLSDDWKFSRGAYPEATNPNFNDADWETVSVPHDWAIHEAFIIDGDGNTGKLPWKGEGWYRKQLSIDPSLEGKRVYLLFDGIMAFPQVYLNGKLAGQWDYGYNSFYLDVTDLIDFGGKNILAIYADTRNHGSRWYPGAGIYRKVQLITVSQVHVETWGTYVTTPIIKQHYADVRIANTILNKTSVEKKVTLEAVILNPDGVEVGRKVEEKMVVANGSRDFEVTLPVGHPQKWDIENPVLYTAITTVFEGENILDQTTTPFGIRSIGFTADDGFYLNDRRVQLKGVNLHHDFGPLGAAFNKRAMERQLEIMKAMGVNAIRNSHNVAAPELAQLCDEMGLLLFNEIFDKYDNKADITDTTNFDGFAHRNIRNFIKRDRNHPSIFLWSVGNEIGDVQRNIDGGFKKLHTMLNYVNKYDPTRPTTLVCDNLESASLRHFDYYDVHSWNYGRRYRLARQLEPNKSVIISESASTLSTRGFYELPLPEKKTNFTNSLQVSSYDLNAPWWAEVADDDFMWQQEESYIAGEFVWTGFDYLGEPTPYNNDYAKELGMTDNEASRSSYFGIVDLVGIPKDRYYLYKSYWKPEENMVHILPHWNWDEQGKNVPVFVYTNGDCAELFINNVSQGKRCKDPKSKNSIDRFRLMWTDTEYQAGEVKAVAYKNGKVIGEKTLKTAGEAYRLQLTPDRTAIAADGADLSYVLVECLDREGNVVPLADQKLTVQLSGQGSLAGVGNGNPQSFTSFSGNEVNLFYGKAMIIIKAGKTVGKTKVAVSADGLKSSSTVIEIN